MFKRFIKYYLGILLVGTSIFHSCFKKEIPEIQEEPEITTHCDSVVGFISYCDSLAALGIINDYKYPIIPGMNEWAELTTEQMDSVLQIPDEILLKMCTLDLIETCFNYPLLFKISGTYEYFNWWWDNIYRDFNGIPELVARCDSPQKILTKYLEYDAYPYADSVSDGVLKMHIMNKSIFIELFLAHQDIITRFTDKELILLGQKAKENYYSRNNYLNIEFSISPIYSIYLLGRLMYYGHYEPIINEMKTNADLNSFINYGSKIWVTGETWDFIMNNIDNYLLQLQSNEN